MSRGIGDTDLLGILGRGPSLLVAPSDANDQVKAAANVVATGSHDQHSVQSAVDALGSGGGSVVMAAGTWNFSGPVVLSRNVRTDVYGYGATVNLSDGAIGFKIAQGIASAVGARVQGVRIDGQSNERTVGAEFEDTNNPSLIDVRIEDCATGILFESLKSGNFVEGALLDNCLLTGNTTGVKFSVVNGTGSFAQTRIRGLKVVVGDDGTGIVVGQSSILQRSMLDGTVWIGSDETAISLDGNIEDSILRFGVEGEGSSTGNTGLLVGSNCSNLDTMGLHLLFTGTVNTQITNSSGKAFHYYPNANTELVVQTAGTVFQSYRRHGDASDRVRVEGLTAGGKISLGNGTLLDTALARSAAGILDVTGAFQFTEQSDAAAGASNTARLYAKDNGSGKTQLVVRFPTGAVQVLATEP